MMFCYLLALMLHSVMHDLVIMIFYLLYSISLVACRVYPFMVYEYSICEYYQHQDEFVPSKHLTPPRPQNDNGLGHGLPHDVYRCGHW